MRQSNIIDEVGRRSTDVICGTRISQNDDTVMEHLARYIIRASFSQKRILAFNPYSSLP